MTPDRAALAAAIAKRTKLADDLVRIRLAQEPARLRTRAAEDALAEAEQALRDARADEPRRIVDALITGGAPDLGAGLNDALAAATEAADMARRVSRALAERERIGQDDLDGATAQVREAARRVLRNSPEAAELVRRLTAARRTIAEISSIGASILDLMPANWDVQPRFDAAEASRAIRPWREALAMLETDADAPLPNFSPPSASPPGLQGGSEAARPNGRAA